MIEYNISTLNLTYTFQNRFILLSCEVDNYRPVIGPVVLVWIFPSCVCKGGMGERFLPEIAISVIFQGLTYPW